MAEAPQGITTTLLSWALGCIAVITAGLWKMLHGHDKAIAVMEERTKNIDSKVSDLHRYFMGEERKYE